MIVLECHIRMFFIVGSSYERKVYMQEKLLLEVKGLDIEEGLKNCGSEELYLRTIENFYKLIESKCEKIEACIANGSIYDYTVEVHALKNTTRMIGALELSELFYELESLGKEGSIEALQEKTPEVLSLCKEYKTLLAAIEGKGPDRKEAEGQYIIEILERLYAAVDVFDLDTADKMMLELNQYILPKDLNPLAKALDVALADVALEEVLRLALEMKAQLEKKALILLIDDDEVNRYVVTNLLQEEYRILSAHSGESAFEILKEHTPDLILLDVFMPGMDGYAVLRKLKSIEQYADIPVVFLTSDEEESAEVHGFSEGATDFLRKPLRKAVAVQRMNRIIELSYLQKNLKEEVARQTEVAEKRRRKVERMSLQMVKALANTIDAKDSYTNGHSSRVAKYSVMLAERMGYQGEKLEQVQYAALLHDIGKIGIPREIINKPSKLTDEEYELIKAHPKIGGNILDEITEIPDIAVGARWHHERYDGKGYPDRLRGHEIPELARIIGVADAYDAMTSKRSYRDVLPQEVVLAEIEKGKGSQFDSDIAEHMVSIIKEDAAYQLHE